MVKEENYCFTESLGELNENVWIVSIQMQSSLVSNVEKVHYVQFDNMLDIDVLQLMSIETQVTT
jgi:hypothetical protein